MKVVKNYNIVVVRGAGEMASGVIYQLYKSGYNVIALEQNQPVCVRRPVCFANTFYEKQIEIEGVTAVLVNDVQKRIKNNIVPVLIDPTGKSIEDIAPFAVIDARMKKKYVSSKLVNSYVQIGLGPGFEVDKNCNAVVETNRGVNLGKVILNGKAEKFTGIPTNVQGYTIERVLYAPADGRFTGCFQIGDLVKANEVFGTLDEIEIIGQIEGVVRGQIYDNVQVIKGQKIGDIDPRGKKEICYKISEIGRASCRERV